MTQGILLIIAACMVGLGLGGIAYAGLDPLLGASNAGHRMACSPRASMRPANHNRLAKAILVPRGAIEVLLCRYYGLDETPRSKKRPGWVARERVIRRRRAVERFGTELDQLRPMPNRPITCPRDSGSQIDVIFVYRHMKDDVVTVGLSGCQTVVNERLHRGFWLSRSLRRQLLRAV